MGKLARINAAKKAAVRASEASGHVCGEGPTYRLLTGDELDQAFSGPRGIYNAEVTLRCKCGRDIYLTDEEPDAVCEPDDWESYDLANPPGCGRRWTILIAGAEASP